MITVLTGENGYGLRGALRKRIETFMSDHGDISVERLDGAAVELARVNESLRSAPFLAERKLVVLESPGTNKQLTDNIDSILQNVAESTDLIIVDPKVDKRSVYYKILKHIKDFQEFSELDEQGAARWLTITAKEQGAELSLADARFLVERVGLNQQLLAQELAKLSTYRSEITRETIVLLVDATPQSKIFDLVEAAFAGNAERSLELYRDQREQKVDPSQIIALMAWQLRVLAILASAGQRTLQDIAREAKLSPYVVQKSHHIASRLTLARLKGLINELLHIDARSKRENLDLDEALQNYLLLLAE